ncbi:hypothetical protein EJ08DRAFT_676552 [Tothia fuscella]|uniref:Uncharacterized protein n=1 Tax=Tothia fuscella TaxID=1048955 RepID=A0A9P4NYM8_9PEZI|nr:hypothetical protein EJ08DRAFT_676552 [Tothia fuscella]
MADRRFVSAISSLLAAMQADGPIAILDSLDKRMQGQQRFLADDAMHIDHDKPEDLAETFHRFIGDLRELSSCLNIEAESPATTDPSALNTPTTPTAHNGDMFVPDLDAFARQHQSAVKSRNYLFSDATLHSDDTEYGIDLSASFEDIAEPFRPQFQPHAINTTRNNGAQSPHPTQQHFMAAPFNSSLRPQQSPEAGNSRLFDMPNGEMSSYLSPPVPARSPRPQLLPNDELRRKHSRPHVPEGYIAILEAEHEDLQEARFHLQKFLDRIQNHFLVPHAQLEDYRVCKRKLIKLELETGNNRPLSAIYGTANKEIGESLVTLDGIFGTINSKTSDTLQLKTRLEQEAATVEAYGKHVRDMVLDRLAAFKQLKEDNGRWVEVAAIIRFAGAVLSAKISPLEELRERKRRKSVLHEQPGEQPGVGKGKEAKVGKKRGRPRKHQ